MQKTLSVIAWLVAWGWALIAGVGGFFLLLHQGPLPITNGWFAMFSGIAACPLTARLLKRYARVAVPGYVQLAVALLIFMAGRACAWVNSGRHIDALSRLRATKRLTMRWSERRTAVRFTFKMTSTLPVR